MKDEGLPAGQSFVDGGSVVAEILCVNIIREFYIKKHLQNLPGLL
jgi:hypothetical protein